MRFSILIQEFDIQCDFVEVPSHKDVFALVKEKKVSAGVAPNIFGLINAHLNGLVESNIIFSPRQLYYAVPEGTNKKLLADIDSSLRRWKKDNNSYYYKTLDYWLSQGSRQRTVIPRWVIFTASGAFCFIILLAFWNKSLSVKVQQRTQALAKSEEKYKRFFTTVAHGWAYHKIVTDDDNRPIDYIFLEVNDAFEKLTGLSRELIIGKRVTEALPGIDKDPARWIEKFGAVAQTGISTHFESYAESLQAWYSVSASCPEQDYFIAVFENTSERKQAAELLQKKEQEYRTLFEQAGDYILIWEFTKENELILVDVNQAACEIHGYTREEFIGKNVKEIDRGDSDEDSVRELMSKIMAGELVLFETIHAKKDGTTFPIEVSAKLLGSGEDPPLILAIERDITKRKQAESGKEKLEKQLRQAHKMEAVGTMAGGIAHDFNNLLSIISGNIDIIQYKQKTGSNAEKNIEHVINATYRAEDLIKQILTFSRQEKMELIPVNLSILLDESLKLLRSTIPATVKIVSNVGSEAISINADSTQLQQIILNLCANAVHAMNEKGLLRIDLEEAQLTAQEIPLVTGLRAGKYAKFSISDTGTGMDKETVGKIFDPFFTTKGVGIGTGMGLSVVHGIITEHNGFITVDSTLGLGATFNIYFPTIRENEAEVKTDAVESLPTGTERILFVDDEECIAETCGELLEFQGYKVTSVTSSSRALSIFKSNPQEFDLVFTDQTMPEMSGAELARELLIIRPDIPVVLCSGYSARVSEADAKGIGVREFCMKPMDMKQLATVARRVLDESGKPSV